MKKENRLLWSAFAFLLLMSLLQIFLVLTGKMVPEMVIWFSKLSYIVFFISVLVTLYRKSKDQGMKRKDID